MDARSLGRLAAVQALYQSEINEGATSEAKQFLEANDIKRINKNIFNSIVENVAKNKEKIDELIENNLNENWKIERVDNVLIAVLRAGISEILFADLPKNVVISEYLTIADELHDEDGVRFVNAVLDKV